MMATEGDEAVKDGKGTESISYNNCMVAGGPLRIVAIKICLLWSKCFVILPEGKKG